MFIAMNRFRVMPGRTADFEHVWASRDTHLRDVPGFVEFHLLRGPPRDDHVLYSSHTIWADRAAFEDWTRSAAFSGGACAPPAIPIARRLRSAIPSSRASRFCRP